MVVLAKISEVSDHENCTSLPKTLASGRHAAVIDSVAGSTQVGVTEFDTLPVVEIRHASLTG